VKPDLSRAEKLYGKACPKEPLACKEAARLKKKR
jgi:hypothetical protein